MTDYRYLKQTNNRLQGLIYKPKLQINHKKVAFFYFVFLTFSPHMRVPRKHVRRLSDRISGKILSGEWRMHCSDIVFLPFTLKTRVPSVAAIRLHTLHSSKIFHSFPYFLERQHSPTARIGRNLRAPIIYTRTSLHLLLDLSKAFVVAMPSCHQPLAEDFYQVKNQF